MLLNINVKKVQSAGTSERKTVNGSFRINKTKVNSRCFIADCRQYIGKMQLNCPRPGLFSSYTVITPPLFLQSSRDSRLVQRSVSTAHTLLFTLVSNICS